MRRTRCGVTIFSIVVSACAAGAEPASPAAANITKQVQAVLEAHGFEPRCLPFACSMSVTTADPFLISVRWNDVWPDLHDLLKRGFPREDKVDDMRLEFAWCNYPCKPACVRIYLFDAPENVQFRQILTTALNLRNDSFSPFDLQIVGPAKGIEIGHLKERFRTANRPNLSAIGPELEQLLRNGRKPISDYHLNPNIHQTPESLRVQTNWVFYTGTSRARFFWRVTVSVAQKYGSQRGWDLSTVVDLGRQLASQSAPVRIGDEYDDIENTLLWGLGQDKSLVSRIVTADPLYTLLPKVRSDISAPKLYPPAQLSPLRNISRLIFEECVNALIQNDLPHVDPRK